MLKKTTFIALFCLISGFLFFISACSDSVTPSHQVDCQSKETNCLSLSSPNAKLMFDSEFIMVEQPQTITIESNLPLKELKLVPINMNMGTLTIPMSDTVKNKDSNTYETAAYMFLGMCSEPVMEWQLVISYENAESELIPVHSYWNRESYNEHNLQLRY